MVVGRWGSRVPLRGYPYPQNSTTKAHVLVGVLVMVGFAVGKGKWCPGARRRGRGGTVALDPGAPCRAGDLAWGASTSPFLSSSSAPVPKVRTCHLCLLEDPSIGCISGSEKCTISPSSPCMVITIYYGEFKTAWGLGHRKRQEDPGKRGLAFAGPAKLIF